MIPFVVRVSRWRQTVPLTGCLIILAVSCYFVAQRGPSALTWVVMIAAAMGASGCADAWSRDTKRLVIDEDGIWCFTWQTGLILWKELDGVFIRSESGKDYLCFTVRDREVLRRAGATGRVVNNATRATGFGDLCLNAAILGLRTKEAAEFAARMIVKKEPNHPTEPLSPSRGGSS